MATVLQMIPWRPNQCSEGLKPTVLMIMEIRALLCLHITMLDIEKHMVRVGAEDPNFLVEEDFGG